MIKYLTLLFSVLSISAGQFTLAQNELNLEINKIENQIKYDVENSLRSVLGNQVPLSVFVKFEIDRTPAGTSEETQSPQPELPLQADNAQLDYFETGYMSLPSSVLPLKKEEKKETTQKLNENKDDKIKFKNLFVDLLIGNDLSKELEKQVQNTVQSLLSSYNPQIRVQRLAMYKPPEEKPKETAKTNEEQKTPEPERKPSAEEQLKQAELNAPWWQKFSYQILLATGLFTFLIGLILFSRSIKSGFSILSEGLAASSGKNSTTQIEAAPLSLPSANNMTANTAGPNSNNPVDEVEVSELDITSNLIIIQNMVKEQPEAILSSVNDSYEDYKGIRWLLTHIEVQSRQTLRDLLGEAFFISRNEAKYFNPRAWLQDFTERLVLAQVAKSGSLNKILTQEQIHKIYHFSRETLNEIIIKSRDPNYWRVAREVLPAADFLKLTQGLNIDDWKIVLASINVKADSLNSASLKLLKEIESYPVDETKKEKLKAINLLGPQLKNTLLSLQLGTEHQFLDEIRSVSIEVSNRLEAQVWIADKIQDIPVDVHREFITRLSVENLFAVIYALPQHLRDYMLDCIPEGNRKTMTIDLLQRAEQQTTDSQKKAAQQMARKYLEDLRLSHEVGNFKLKTQLRAAS